MGITAGMDTGNNIYEIIFSGGINMIEVNAVGDVCPIPVVKTKKAIQSLSVSDTVVTLVDNEIAVANLMKLAASEGFQAESHQLDKGIYQVEINVVLPEAARSSEDSGCKCGCGGKKKIVIAIDSDRMGTGDKEFGCTLMKSFIYALSQQQEAPDSILFYNRGAFIPCMNPPAIEDLRNLAAGGTEIFTCGTCLNYYGLSDMLQVGEITNMYTIVEKLTGADLVIKP